MGADRKKSDPDGADIITVWMEVNQRQLARAIRVLDDNLIADFQFSVGHEIRRFGDRMRKILERYKRKEGKQLAAKVINMRPPGIK